MDTLKRLRDLISYDAKDFNRYKEQVRKELTRIYDEHKKELNNVRR
jgi:archaellum component FlaC